LPKAMEDLTKKIKAAEAKLADADFFSRDPAGFQKTSEGLGKLQAELEAAEERWLELEALREELEASS
jgi:ABC transport system ATP-binding/permease protein